MNARAVKWRMGKKGASPDERIYQRELISGLGFSNKTIIEALKRLVSAGILEQGMEKRSEKGKTIWTKWYEPTFQGKWLTLLLKPPANVSHEVAREVIVELFKMYMENVVKLSADYEIEPTIFEATMNKVFLQVLEKGTTPATDKSRVAVYGSAAVDTIVVTCEDSDANGAQYPSDVHVHPGGSGVNVSVALRRLGIPVSFVGKIGGDAEGVLLMREFLKEGVDTSKVILNLEQKTAKTFTTVDRSGKRRTYVLGGDGTALSISSPEEIDWNEIEGSEAVYIGEVVTEIAELIASFARSREKRVFFCPGSSHQAFNAEKVRTVLRNVHIVILSKGEWVRIRNGSTTTDLIEIGPEAILVTEGVEGCDVFTKDENYTVPGYSVNVKDPTGARDAFAAGVISAMLETRSLRDCVDYALAVSSLSVTDIGARSTLPTRTEVEEFLKAYREGQDRRTAI